MDQLIEELNENHELIKVSELQCLERSNIFFKSGQGIQPFLKHFGIIFKKYPNRFSEHFIETALQNSTFLSLPTFKSDIWEPVYTKCLSFMVSIKHKTIKLCEVHNIYNKYLGQKHDIKYQLNSLQSALDECQDIKPITVVPQWIEDAVEHMTSYLSFCKQSTAAELILNLKETLRLSGNFELVEEVAEQMVWSAQDNPLSSINQVKVASAVSFFAEISSCNDKYLTIKAFAECSDIVQWIQKETKGRQGVFVLYV